MKLDKLLNIVGISLLLVCFGISLWRVFSRSAEKLNTETMEIRFAHWQLEGGIREAFEVLSSNYEEIKRQEAILETKQQLEQKPGDAALQRRLERLESGELYPVRVVQTPIPERVYAPWSKTRLIGGDAPEIICLGKGITKDLTAKFFLPMRGYIDQPNPYNEGTPLEGVPWRDTFIDGLEGPNSFDRVLLEHYGIPYTVLTIRVYYNKQLYRRIIDDPENAALKASIGDAVFPETYKDFIGLCEAVLAYNKRHGTSIMPIAGSSYNAPSLMNNLFMSQTQALFDEHDRWKRLDMGTEEMILKVATGELDYDNPVFRSGFDLMHEVGQYMQHGFQQLQREDATFRFIQEQALMITTGSWDAPSLWQQAGNLFDIGVARLPIPTSEHPVYGQFVKGKLSEAGAAPYGNLAVINYKSEEKTATAIDFLMYLTSMGGNYEFSEMSGWLPAVAGVEPPERLKNFKPEPYGVPNGPRPDFSKSDGEIARVYEQNKYLIVDANAGVDEFYEAIGDDMQVAARADIRKIIRTNEKQLERRDSTMGANYWLSRYGGDEADVAREKLDIILTSQHAGEYHRIWLDAQLKKALAAE